MSDDIRVDPLSGHHVIVVPDRQARPNLPGSGDPSGSACPFCVGGREAPDPYDVRWFPNRWPSLGEGRAEVVLFSPDHDASLGTLAPEQVRRVVDLWADRTEALGARDDVEYVLVFENRGAAIGATIPHPHGQIYAFGEVPPTVIGEFARADARGACTLCEANPGDRLVAHVGEWQAWIPAASAHPYGLVLAPRRHVGSLPEATDTVRQDLADLLGSVLGGLDRLFDEATPYMLWIHQRPAAAGGWPWAHLHVEIVPFRRAPGVNRYVAAAELGSGIFINSVDPVTAATALRQVCQECSNR